MTEKAFVTQLENIFINENEGFLTKKEVGVGYGVADLILVKLNPDKCAVRRENNQFKKLLREEYFRVLYHIPEEGQGNPISEDVLTEKTRLSKSFLKYRILRELERDKYIKRVSGNFYFRIDGWVPIAEEIIAIEAKLKNWKQGVFQANRYRSFANRVYLAVPTEIAHLVDKALLKRCNVGLIVFDVKRNHKKISRAKREEPLNVYKYNLVAEFVLSRQILANYPTF